MKWEIEIWSKKRRWRKSNQLLIWESEMFIFDLYDFSIYRFKSDLIFLVLIRTWWLYADAAHRIVRDVGPRGLYIHVSIYWEVLKTSMFDSSLDRIDR